MRFQVEIVEMSGAVYEVDASTHDEAEALVEAMWVRGNRPADSYKNLDILAIRLDDEK